MARKKRAGKAKRKAAPAKTRKKDAAQDFAQSAGGAPENVSAPVATAGPEPRETQLDGPSDDWDEIPPPSDDEIDGTEEDADDLDDGGH